MERTRNTCSPVLIAMCLCFLFVLQCVLLWKGGTVVPVVYAYLPDRILQHPHYTCIRYIVKQTRLCIGMLRYIRCGHVGIINTRYMCTIPFLRKPLTTITLPRQ
jgi:hypothetical protein